MKLLVLSCSLSPTSRSALLAERLTLAWKELGQDVELVDLREVSLPFCDGAGAFSDANATSLRAKVERAHAVALAVPIYNYDVGGAARNLIAMTGNSWRDKVVGMLGAAGGQRSYMALVSVTNSLMLDFRCVIVPRFVYASDESFDDGRLVDQGVEKRIVGLAGDLHRFAGALSNSGPSVHSA